jgi:hypothetical protein
MSAKAWLNQQSFFSAFSKPFDVVFPVALDFGHYALKRPSHFRLGSCALP